MHCRELWARVCTSGLGRKAVAYWSHKLGACRAAAASLAPARASARFTGRPPDRPAPVSLVPPIRRRQRRHCFRRSARVTTGPRLRAGLSARAGAAARAGLSPRPRRAASSGAPDAPATPPVPAPRARGGLPLRPPPADLRRVPRLRRSPEPQARPITDHRQRSEKEIRTHAASSSKPRTQRTLRRRARPGPSQL